MLLSLDRLAKNRIPPAVLLFHSPRGLIKIAEHLRLERGYVRDDSRIFGINLQHGTAAWAGQIEAVLLFCHVLNDKSNRGFAATPVGIGSADDTLSL